MINEFFWDTTGMTMVEIYAKDGTFSWISRRDTYYESFESQN